MKNPVTTLLVLAGGIGAAYLLWPKDTGSGEIQPGAGKWLVLNASGIPIRFDDDKQFRQVPFDANVVVSLPSGWRGEISEAVQVEFAGEGAADVQLRVQEGHASGTVDLAVFTDKGGPAGKLRIEFVQPV